MAPSASRRGGVVAASYMHDTSCLEALLDRGGRVIYEAIHRASPEALAVMLSCFPDEWDEPADEIQANRRNGRATCRYALAREGDRFDGVTMSHKDTHLV
jgi:hypothetical protein